MSVNALSTRQPCCSQQLIIFFALMLSLALTTLPSQSIAEPSPGAIPPEADWIYTSRAGDSLKSVAKKYLANSERWTDLLHYNRLSNATLLPPGTPVRIPLTLLKSYPKPATLLQSRGTVWVRKAHTTPYIPALAGQQISIGDELKTLDGYAMIKFADGSNLQVAKHSIIIFNTLTHYGESGMVDTRFRLNKGGIKTEVSPRKGPAARYEVSTPSAVAAVRGTSFRLRLDNNDTIAEVTEGSVQLSNAANQIQLHLGQGARVSHSGRLQSRQLLPPPRLDLPEKLTDLPLSLSWQPVKGAASYIAEILQTGPNDPLPSDQLPLIIRRIKGTNLRLPKLDNGDYLLVIRAVDFSNIEGVDAQANFQIARQAKPAKLIAPLSKANLQELIPLFQWQIDTPGNLSSLEIARDQEFKALFSRTPFSGQLSARSEPPLTAGEYYWRVVTMAGRNNFARSETRVLTIRDQLESPQVIAVNYLDDRAKVFWKSVKHANSYLIQLSEDELFQRLVREDQQRTTSALLRLTPGRTYWVRVKGIGSEFYSSAFGKPQLLKIQI